MKHVFVSGGTGYLGVPMIRELLHRGYRVTTLVRARSFNKLPNGVHPVLADALQSRTFAGRVEPAGTFVHLTGVSHPSPWKADQFRAVDLTALRASVEAARHARVCHFVYVSVAHPAPIMKKYVEVRSECEHILAQSGMNVTVLRPWYVLGPGHRWPHVLRPFYATARLVPAARPAAERLGLVTRAQMVRALVVAVESRPAGVRILEVPAIRVIGSAGTLPSEPQVSAPSSRAARTV